MPKAGRTKVAAKSHKLIHPQSRKANKLGAREMHNQRVKKVHQETNLRNSLLIEKLIWFKDALDPDKQSYSKADAEDLVDRYLGRFEEELEQIAIVNSIKSRSGRQHAAREDVIGATRRREEEQFQTCGIEIPDIIDARNLKLLRAWDGNPRVVSNIRLRSVVRTGSGNPSDSSSTRSGSQDGRRNDGTALVGDAVDNKMNDGVPDEVDDDEEEEDDDEGVEDDLLDSDSEDDHHRLQDTLEDEGVESR